MALIKYWETKEFTAYADMDKSKRVGDKTLFWIVNDYHVKKENSLGQEFKSDRVLFEIDCQKKTRRVVELFLYSLPMGDGRVIYSNTKVNDAGGAVPEPGKVGHKTWEIACTIK